MAQRVVEKDPRSDQVSGYVIDVHMYTVTNSSYTVLFLHLYCLQAVNYAQRKGLEVETTKKCMSSSQLWVADYPVLYVCGTYSHFPATDLDPVLTYIRTYVLISPLPPV